MHPLARALAAALLFGAATPASKWLLASFGPVLLAGLLYLGAALAVAPLALRGGGASWLRLDATNRRRLAGATLFGGVLAPVLLLAALHRVLAGSVALLLPLELVATALLGVALFREHLGRGGWLGVAGVVAASALVAGDSGWPGIVAAGLTAAACVCWALDNHWTALIDGLTPARTTFAKGLVAGATNLAIGLAASPPVTRPMLVALALAVGALSYGASIALLISAAQQLGATRAQAAFAAAPFLGAALSFGVLGEPLGIVHGAAAALLVPAVALVLLSQHGHRHAHEALEHVHAHRHDDGHHAHAHADGHDAEWHSHPHRHERQVHAHAHWPDLHHRHRHRPVEGERR